MLTDHHSFASCLIMHLYLKIFLARFQQNVYFLGLKCLPSDGANYGECRQWLVHVTEVHHVEYFLHQKRCMGLPFLFFFNFFQYGQRNTTSYISMEFFWKLWHVYKKHEVRRDHIEGQQLDLYVTIYYYYLQAIVKALFDIIKLECFVPEMQSRVIPFLLFR